MGRFQRAIALTKASWAVLQQEKKLLILPIISFICTIALIISFLIPTVFYIESIAPQFMNDANNSHKVSQNQTYLIYGIIFCWYVLNFFIVIFFNAVILACALRMLDGEDASLKYGFKVAMKRIGVIFQWTLVSATIGVIFNILEERLGFVGRFIVKLIGIVFTVISFMVLPTLIVEGTGPLAALKKSTTVLKKTWGEALGGIGSMGIVFFLIQLPVIFIVCAGVGNLITDNIIINGLLVAAGIALFIFINLLQTTLMTIYKAALYRYAANGQLSPNFDKNLLESSIKLRNSKGRNRSIWRR